MPKIKTHRGAAKRIKISGSGKILRKNASASHLLEKKSRTRKRRLKKYVEVTGGFRTKVQQLVPYK